MALTEGSKEAPLQECDDLPMAGSRKAQPNLVGLRRAWTEESMERALKEVGEGKLSVRRAALQYALPKSTLHDRVTCKVIPGAKVGGPRYLDDEEEEELVNFLIGAASIGY